MFCGKKLLCQNIALNKCHWNFYRTKCLRAKVTLRAKESLCKSVTSCKSDPACKRVAVQKCHLVQK